ncbi:MAG: hypothetical protein ACK51S_08605 [Alphaproteobacteria bacterium]
MTAKKPAKQPTIHIKGQVGDTEDQAMARGVLRPSIGAAIATHNIYKKSVGGELLDIGALSEELVEQCGKVHDGDLKRVESMLVAQAHTLDALFNRLTTLGMGQEFLKQFEVYMRLAFKAQAQARATVEALAEIKNPRPVAFVKQANVGQNIQVNNGADVSTPGAATRTHGNIENAQNGLLGVSDGEWLDTGTTGATGRGDPALATVDAFDRTQDGSGKGAR